MKPKMKKDKFRKAPKSTDFQDETRNKNMKPKMKKNKFRKAPKSTDFEDEFVDNDAISAKWFDEIADDPQDFEPVTEQVLMDLKDEAKKCHDSEVTHYNIKNSKNNPDHRWMKTVMSKGTVADKIAAHTVAIQTNPVCNLETLKNLVNMVKVGRKKECLNAIDVLTEMFLSDLLRPDKKLKEFDVRPLSRLNDLSSGNAITRRKLLTYWYFEDQLKELYKLFVQSLNNVSHDTVDHNKEKAVSCMYKLLAGNPEQEKNLLSFLVNKLGDPSANVVSKTIYSLGQLLLKHPNMQAVVLKEVEKLLFRPNIPMKAQYYGLCFLSQFYLDHDTSEVAKRLIEVYFSFFKACVKKGEVDSRMMSALLTGVKRAYPYAKVELSKISDHIDTIYRIVHIATFNIGLHALCLLYQVSDYANDISNRFYQALYKKLIDPEVLTTTHQAMLLSLIYRSLLKDQETNRIKVFVKRLLQISLNAQPAFACGILYLVSQLMGKKENIQAIGLKQSFGSKMGDDDDDGEEKYQDVKDETMVSSMEDNNVPKESVQEVSPDKNIAEEEEDVKPDPAVLSEALKASSWYHCQNTFRENRCQEYDPFSRNPLYAGGDKCTYTELIALQNHFHPSVSLFASQILKGDVIQYSGDPLKDFTLIRFLERFVFKNPKKPEDVSKSGAHPTFGKRKLYRPSGVKSIPVNSMSYLSGNEENVPVDELFMYRYLQKKHQDKPIKRGSDDDDDSDLESVQSEEFEEMLDKMPSMKDANMDDDDDDDLNFMEDVEATMKSNRKQKKSKKNKDEDEPSDDEALSDEDDGLSDEDLSGEEDLMNMDEEELSEDDLQDEDMMDLEGLSEDEDDDEDIVFDDDDDEPRSTKNSSSKKKHKDLKKGISSLFASAEEFSALLEDEGGSKIAPGGSNVFSNKDNSSVKQIAWEEKRNQYLQGHKRVMGKKKQKGHWKKPNKPAKKNNFKKSKFRK